MDVYFARLPVATLLKATDAVRRHLAGRRGGDGICDGGGVTSPSRSGTLLYTRIELELFRSS